MKKRTIGVIEVVLTYVLIQHNSLWRQRTGTQLIFVGLTTFVACLLPQLWVTSQDWDSINYSWDWPLLLAFVRRRNIPGQPPAAGKFENYHWFKQLRAIQKCNKNDLFPNINIRSEYNYGRVCPTKRPVASSNSDLIFLFMCFLYFHSSAE